MVTESSGWKPRAYILNCGNTSSGFSGTFRHSKGISKNEAQTGQHVLQMEFGIRRLKFPWDTYFYSFASLLAALQNGTKWPRRFSTPVPWHSVSDRMPVISLALLTLPAANREKKIFLQFGNPAFATVLTYNSGFCLQYLDSLWIIYQSIHAWCQTTSNLITKRCPEKRSCWVKKISLLSIVTKSIKYSRHIGGILEDRLCLHLGNLPHLLFPQPKGIPS